MLLFLAHEFAPFGIISRGLSLVSGEITFQLRACANKCMITSSHVTPLVLRTIHLVKAMQFSLAVGMSSSFLHSEFGCLIFL